MNVILTRLDQGAGVGSLALHSGLKLREKLVHRAYAFEGPEVALVLLLRLLGLHKTVVSMRTSAGRVTTRLFFSARPPRPSSSFSPRPCPR